MRYKIHELAKLSGISTRTLRYYDEIGLLAPEMVEENGYRIYAQTQVDALQQILFYRHLGVSLEEIKKITTASDYDKTQALTQHLVALQQKKQQIEQLICNVEKTIVAQKEGRDMQDKEKFVGFQQAMIAENEEKYGTEIRQAYGDAQVNATNEKIRGMQPQQWQQAQQLSTRINETLREAFAQGDPAGMLAQEACALHRQWLCLFWKEGTYSQMAHKSLADMYMADERFRAYYDDIAIGCAAFLRDAIYQYCNEKNA